jgi:hypothetical protein
MLLERRQALERPAAKLAQHQRPAMRRFQLMECLVERLVQHPARLLRRLRRLPRL